ncbi:hypothetical protein [Flocculibacter collagenilyticus]|uniref:hypothetical protein n=1 Tax=Flocculibacter collagenilyticus TaxID=2744479 RepID=UPI0018F27ACA|nr:hypothetical protein [Flocculibacter collagenilyticus]
MPDFNDEYYVAFPDITPEPIDLVIHDKSESRLYDGFKLLPNQEPIYFEQGFQEHDKKLVNFLWVINIKSGGRVVI